MENDETSDASLPESGSQPSARWRVVFVGIFRVLSLGFVFITIFVSSLGLLLFAAAVILREYWLKKYPVTVLPRPFIAWLHRTRIYDVFVRRGHANRLTLP